MTAQENQSVKPGQTMLQRSIVWLRGQHPLPDVKSALNAIVVRVCKGELADNADSRGTCDALTQHYVDRGGDLADLPSLPEPGTPQPTQGELVTPLHTAGPDYGLLYPDVPPAAPLSKEEKRDRLQALRAQITRPGGF